MARVRKKDPKKESSNNGPNRSSEGCVLVVDDSEGVRGYLAQLGTLFGHSVLNAESGEQALALIEDGLRPDLILLDVLMPGLGGLETLRRIGEFEPKLPVVVISVVGRVPTIVEAMRLGAVDFITKPFEDDEVYRVFEQYLNNQGSREQRREDEVRFSEEVWKSGSMSQIGEVIDQISDTNVTVLVQGESGVGKEIVARAIHERSARLADRFIKVNCAALPDDLLESELFGYEKGAFTGAHSRKTGKFELAHQGTIFLDEIGEMSPALQAKLLQVLQDRSFSRLGGNRDVSVDIRVVCATHRPLLAMVSNRTFREDLYFRLNVVNIQLPPLRERPEEILSLVELFLERYAQEYRRPRPAMSSRLLNALREYHFPGNVRELENMIKRVVVLGSEEAVLREVSSSQGMLDSYFDNLDLLMQEVKDTAGQVPLKEVSRRASLQVEREIIDAVLQKTSWNRKRAAGILGVSYKTLLQKIRDCELQV